MFVKFCGFTRQHDLEYAASLGIQAAGFIFYPKSKRYITPAKAAELSRLIQGTGIIKTGVFVDTTPDDILHVMEKARLDCAQVYSEEAASRLSPQCTVILAHRIRLESDIPRHIPEGIPYLLLDTWSSSSMGGTGTAFDWTMLKRHTIPSRTIMAGGINAESIGPLLEKYIPYGIDVSSGIEERPGIKSKEKMKRLMTIAKEAKNVYHAG
ncbi:MAG: phosphoribosylanthranilate isomerase [Spirochaetota bacterium]